MKYPPAIWKGDGQNAGAYIGVPFKLCWHTTETTSVPGYGDGVRSPHITYDTPTRRWVQHLDFDVAARSLRNEPGGVQTNRANVLQVEIVCYSAKAIADQSMARLWVGHLPNTAYQDLRAFAEWAMGAFRIKDQWPEKQALSSSQANAPGFRLTGSAWLAWNGQIGHQHIPENSHWDPGAIDWGRLVVDMATPEEIAQAVWAYAARTGNSSMWMQVDRNYRNISELVGAHRNKQLGVPASPVNETAIAQAVVAAMTPELRAAVAAELAKLTLKATQ